MKYFFQVMPNGVLMPSNDETADYIFRRKVGDVLSHEVKIARSYPQLKRFMSMINATFDMQSHFQNKEYYRYWLTMKCGRFSTIEVPNGNIIYKAHSIAFENMEEEDFRQLFSDAIDVFLKEFGQGQTEADIMKVISYG